MSGIFSFLSSLSTGLNFLKDLSGSKSQTVGSVAKYPKGYGKETSTTPKRDGWGGVNLINHPYIRHGNPYGFDAVVYYGDPRVKKKTTDKISINLGLASHVNAINFDTYRDTKIVTEHPKYDPKMASYFSKLMTTKWDMQEQRHVTVDKSNIDKYIEKAQAYIDDGNNAKNRNLRVVDTKFDKDVNKIDKDFKNSKLFEDMTNNPNVSSINKKFLGRKTYTGIPTSVAKGQPFYVSPRKPGNSGPLPLP